MARYAGPKRNAQAACLDMITIEAPARCSRRSKDLGGNVKPATQNTAGEGSFSLQLPSRLVRPGDVRTQTQTIDGGATQTTVKTGGTDGQTQGMGTAETNCARPPEAWAGDSFVAGGVGFSPKTCRANENNAKEALGQGGEVNYDTQKTEEYAVDPYKRLAKLARNTFKEPKPVDRKNKNEKEKEKAKANSSSPSLLPAQPLTSVFVYFHTGVSKLRRNIFVKGLSNLGAVIIEDNFDNRTTHVVTDDAQWMEIFSVKKKTSNTKPKPKTVAQSTEVLDLTSIIAVSPEWCVECIRLKALVDTALYPPGSGTKGKGKEAVGDGSENSSLPIAERRRLELLALQDAAKDAARQAADAAEFAAHPDADNGIDAVFAAFDASEKLERKARALEAAATRAGPAPNWVAIPDSEQQQRAYLGRVKIALACQQPTNAQALPGGAGTNKDVSRFENNDSEGSARNSLDSQDTYGGLDEGGLFSNSGDPKDWKNAGKLNAHLMKPLSELADIYETVLAVDKGVDKYKAKNHKMVVAALKELDFFVTDVKQLINLPNPETGELTGKPLTSAFAKKKSTIRDKIAEILTTGRLQKLEMLKTDKRVSALLQLGKIWGVGPETARRLHDRHGYDSIEKLKARVKEEEEKEQEGEIIPKEQKVLTPQQRIGLKHFREFELKIPREEAAAIGRICKEAVEQVCGAGRCQVTLAGSFRRGNPVCGDIDVLISPFYKFAQDASQLSDLEVEQLENERKLLTDCGTSSSKTAQGGALQNGSLDGDAVHDGDSVHDGIMIAHQSGTDTSNLPVIPRRPDSPKRQTYVDRLDDILPNVLSLIKQRGLITDDLGKGKGRSYMGVARVPMDVELLCESEANNTDSVGALGGSEQLSSDIGSPNPTAANPPNPRKFRRIDIKVYAPEEYPFALMYFTGSGYFNRSMRWWSKKKFNGMSLGDKGFRVVSGAKESKVEHTKPFLTEHDIFEYLKLAYVAPDDRCV